VTRKSRSFLLISALISFFGSVGVGLLLGLVPSPSWYNFSEIILCALSVFPLTVGSFLGIISGVFWFKNQKLMRKLFYVYRWTQFYSMLFLPFLSQYVGATLNFEIRGFFFFHDCSL
jgi:uncharacterized membrane protein YczE